MCSFCEPPEVTEAFRPPCRSGPLNVREGQLVQLRPAMPQLWQDDGDQA